jgi:hypothetical protein
MGLGQGSADLGVRTGIRDQGSGIRDQGSGIRDQGSGIRRFDSMLGGGDRLYWLHMQRVEVVLKKG